MAVQHEIPLEPTQKESSARTPYMRFYVDDWIGGTRSLTLEQRSMYLEILAAMWALKGPVPACERWLGKRVGVHTKVSRRVRDELVAAGKLRIVGGQIRNARMEREIAAAEAARVKRCGTQAPHEPVSKDIQPQKSAAKSTQPPTPTTSRFQNNKPTSGVSVSARGRSFEFGLGEGGGVPIGTAVPASRRPAAPPPRFVSEDALDRVRSVAPGWDRQFLHRTYLDWSQSREAPNDIDAAFLGWVRRFTKGRPAA